MKLSSVESSTLEALHRMHAEYGVYVSLATLGQAMPEHGRDAIEAAVESLEEKMLVKRDSGASVTLTEDGALALKSM